jgi:hypothetical protein
VPDHLHLFNQRNYLPNLGRVELRSATQTYICTYPGSSHRRWRTPL